MAFSFIRSSKYFLALSSILVVISLILIVYPGPKMSIEFAGGTLMEVRLPEGKTKDELHTALASAEKKIGSLGNYGISVIRNPSGYSFLVRMRVLSNEEHVQLLDTLKTQFTSVQELQYNTIGPSLSADLKKNEFMALSVASLAIIAYLTFAFRKVPRRLSPWKFGILAVLAFIHDVVITTGIFIVIGWFTSFEFDPLFVTALLTILAYSANDTVVIYDRIRANFQADSRSEDLSVSVDRALKQCVTRTVNTAMAALIMLASIFFLGAESIRWFILALIIGTIIGAYSSYFVASPLLVFWKKKDQRK